MFFFLDNRPFFLSVHTIPSSVSKEKNTITIKFGATSSFDSTKLSLRLPWPLDCMYFCPEIMSEIH